MNTFTYCGITLRSRAGSCGLRPFLHIHADGIWIKKTTLEQLEEVGLKVAQQEHKIQICRIEKYLEKKADSLTRIEFYSLMEQVFALPAVQELVMDAVQKHNAGGDS